MRRGKVCFVQAKRAACVGLFLGVLFGFSACTGSVGQPGITDSPVPSPTETGMPTPEQGTPTTEPEGETPTPEITKTPTSGPTDTPVPPPTATAEPTKEPELTLPPEVTSGPENTVTAEPTIPPENLTPTPEPTGQPEYETLLRNGWQRTEDFFGCREIFFSGRFDETVLIAVPARYEYRYTSSADESVSFSVIGEEGLQIQEFLDGLAGETMECYIERETEYDYCYRYTEGEETVVGRIYDCGTEEVHRCMRIELRMTATGTTPAEGHEFYLKER